MGQNDRISLLRYDFVVFGLLATFFEPNIRGIISGLIISSKRVP